MKKSLAMLLSFILCCSMLAGCGNNTKSGADSTQEKIIQENVTGEEGDTAGTEEAAADGEETAAGTLTNVRVTALKGPTAMGMVKLMEDAEAGALHGNNDTLSKYEFTIAASIDEVTPKLIQGGTDIAAVPANLAAVLYNTTNAEIQVLAVNTLGVLYIVDTGDSVHSPEDLKGKTIYASGKGATPEYALNYILSANGIDPEKDVTIEWKTEHSECVAALAAAQDQGGIALLPQPFVTTAQSKNDKIRIALDLTEEWEKLQQDKENPSALITGALVARTDFIKENPEAVKAFMDDYKSSVEYVNADISEASQLIEKYDIVPAAVAQKALPYCNIVFIEGSELKDKLSGYLSVLMEQNPKSVGGVMPTDDFYYSR